MWSFSKFSTNSYCKKMRKHVLKRGLRDWPNNHLVRLVWVWIMELMSHPTKKLPVCTEGGGNWKKGRLSGEENKLFSCSLALFFKKSKEWSQRRFRDHQGYHLCFNRPESLPQKLWEYSCPELLGHNPTPLTAEPRCGQG